MPEVTYKVLKQHLQTAGHRTDGSGLVPVYLVYGEETLCKLVLDQILEYLLPKNARNLNYKPLDGRPENVQPALESVNTFSLLSGSKVVALIDAQLFSSRQESGTLLSKAAEYFEQDKLERAAGTLLSFLALNSLELTDGDQLRKLVRKNLPAGEPQDTDWISTVVGYCQEHSLTVPPSQSSSALIEDAVGKGFPDGNYLVITVDQVDKRRTLYKSIAKHGLVVDCSVPKGSRRADEKNSGRCHAGTAADQVGEP